MEDQITKSTNLLIIDNSHASKVSDNGRYLIARDSMHVNQGKALLVVVMLTLAAAVAWAQDASEVCKSVPTIFKDTTVKAKQSYQSRYKKLLCSATWQNYQDVVNAGVDVTIPIYDIPLPLKANYSRDKQLQWQSSSCDAEERSADFAAEGFLLVKEVRPATATAWLECIRTTQEGAVPRALSCRVTETETSAMFETKWRPVEGMKDAEAPIVRGLDVMHTKCSNLKALKKGTRVGTGGVALLCDGNTDKAPMFVLNTDRGPCSASGALASRVTSLGGRIELQSPMIYRGDNLKMAADLMIVTNGNNLTIDAKRLTIDGAPQIVSFAEDQKEIDRRGSSAGEIRIRAQRLDGGQLTIFNFGQNGGMGSQGGIGDTGLKGAPAARRHWVNLDGCVGGHPGGPGSKGNTGRQGNPGAPGGNGGDVLLEIGAGLKDGVAERIKVMTSRADRDNAQFQCGGTCAGLPGLPGEGGEGGNGGEGGDGAGGDPPCGGHGGGSPGPKGDKGLKGPQQTIRGAPGRIAGL